MTISVSVNDMAGCADDLAERTANRIIERSFLASFGSSVCVIIEFIADIDVGEGGIDSVKSRNTKSDDNDNVNISDKAVDSGVDGGTVMIEGAVAAAADAGTIIGGVVMPGGVVPSNGAIVAAMVGVAGAAPNDGWAMAVTADRYGGGAAAVAMRYCGGGGFVTGRSIEGSSFSTRKR